MGRASSRKRERHLTDEEKQRREKQSTQEPKKKTGVVVLDDPNEVFTLKYDIGVPGGPTRSEFPATFSGKLTADSEADLMRGIMIKMIESFGYTRIVRAVSGVLAEAINPFPKVMRSYLAEALIQGTGLNVRVLDVTSCADCGVEKDVVAELNTEGDELGEQDMTVHAPTCPTHESVDIEAVDPDAEEGAPLPMKPGKTVEWRTGPALFIDTPHRYEPLYKPEEDKEGRTVIEKVDGGESIPVGENEDGVSEVERAGTDESE